MFPRLSLIIMALLYSGCGENAPSDAAVEKERYVINDLFKPTYNLQKLSTQELNYNVSTAQGLLRGELHDAPAEKTSVNDTPATLMEAHKSFNFLGLSYAVASVNTVDENGNVIKTEDEDNLICVLQNSVDAMPKKARIPSSSDITRRYECNDGSSYTSDWNLTQSDDGDALFIITKNLTKDDKSNQSVTTFTLDNNSDIKKITTRSNFKGVEYTIKTLH